MYIQPDTQQQLRDLTVELELRLKTTTSSASLIENIASPMLVLRLSADQRVQLPLTTLCENGDTRDTPSVESIDVVSPGPVFACKACRRVLFATRQLVPHNENSQGQLAFKYEKRNQFVRNCVNIKYIICTSVKSFYPLYLSLSDY